MNKLLMGAAALLVCWLSVADLPTYAAQSTKTLKISEGSMRRLAVETVMPVFPKESRRRLVQGVVVAQVEVSEKGGVETVKVLEAPDDAILKCVSQTLKKWRFKPSTIQGEPVRVVGKLTFYFSIDRGNPRVTNPRDSN